MSSGTTALCDTDREDDDGKSRAFLSLFRTNSPNRTVPEKKIAKKKKDTSAAATISVRRDAAGKRRVSERRSKEQNVYLILE